MTMIPEKSVKKMKKLAGRTAVKKKRAVARASAVKRGMFAQIAIVNRYS